MGDALKHALKRNRGDAARQRRPGMLMRDSTPLQVMESFSGVAPQHSIAPITSLYPPNTRRDYTHIEHMCKGEFAHI
jgi:hypothetical protein